MASPFRFIHFSVLLGVAMAACLSAPAEAATKHKKHVTAHHKTKPAATKTVDNSDRYAEIVVDADTGAVLSQENADRSLHPASLTKIMTLVLTFDALSQKQITAATRLPISQHAASMKPSKVGLKPGESLSVQDGVYSVVTKSANDVAVALAEKIGGSEPQFARMMNLKAREIGMSQTFFVNASGLHDPRQYSSARDMAKLARYVIRNYPQYYHVFGQKAFRYEGHVFRNHNHLMESYQGMDGIKTGYVAASGFNLVASAKRNNHRLIGVVFGGKSPASRNAQMASLLDDGFDRLKDVRVATNAPSAKLKNLEEDRKVSSVSLPKGAAIPTPQQDIAAAATTDDDVEDAAAQGDGRDDLPRAKISPAAGLNIPAAPTAAALSAKTAMAKATTAPTAPVTQAAAPVAVASTAATGPVVSPTLAGAANWSVQLGAYQSRAAADKVLYDSMQKLPKNLMKGRAIVAPLRQSDASWVFRARLTDYTQDEATSACRYIEHCAPIPPGAPSSGTAP